MDSSQPNDSHTQQRPVLPLNPRPAILLGLVAIGLVFGGLGTWAALAPIASAVIAPGVVKVDGDRKKIQHLEGGIIKALLVRDGGVVDAGDVLIRLDENQLGASLAILQGEYAAALALEARLLAERDDLDEIVFSADIQHRTGGARLAEIIADQESLFKARRSALQGETSILNTRITQLEQNIEGLHAQQMAKERQVALIADEIQGLDTLLKKGFTDRSRLMALERQSADLEGERGEHISDIARARTSIAETELQIIQLQRNFQEELIDELRAVRSKRADIEERLGAAQHVLDHVEVRAPVSGVVVGMTVHTVGGVIKPGETILEIVPRDDRLIVEAQIQPIDVDNIAVGQKADIRLTAFKQWTTPILLGDVTYVSADRMMDPHSGQAFYLSRIGVPDVEVEKHEKRVELYPGMPAEVMIKTGERTALQYLAQPLLDSMGRAWREE